MVLLSHWKDGWDNTSSLIIDSLSRAVRFIGGTGENQVYSELSLFTPVHRLLTSGKVPILTQVPVTFLRVSAGLISTCRVLTVDFAFSQVSRSHLLEYLYMGQGFGEAFEFCSTHQNKRAMSWIQRSCVSANCAGTLCSCGGRGWTRTSGSR